MIVTVCALSVTVSVGQDFQVVCCDSTTEHVDVIVDVAMTLEVIVEVIDCWLSVVVDVTVTGLFVTVEVPVVHALVLVDCSSVSVDVDVFRTVAVVVTVDVTVLVDAAIETVMIEVEVGAATVVTPPRQGVLVVGAGPVD